MQIYPWINVKRVLGVVGSSGSLDSCVPGPGEGPYQNLPGFLGSLAWGILFLPKPITGALKPPGRYMRLYVLGQCV